MYRIIEKYETKNHQFNLIKKIIVFKLITNNCYCSSNPNNEIIEVFDKILDHHVKVDVNPTISKIGLSLELSGMTGPLNIEYRKLSSINGDLIVERLQSLLQSNKSINFKGKNLLTATVFTIKNNL